ncbi:hypothetical protein EQ826_15520 [Ectopseudomonas mendocina]|nr:hypothetical protein [Pseudomonas mendocina]TRO24866.1 hypothetical protein EQ826_15520 [Pseudomonas mendocina]
MQELNATPLWQCGKCREIHEDEDGARECCMPEIYELWQCPECKKVHDEEHEANACCEQPVRCPGCSRDHGAGSLMAFAVRVAGHCSQCNPFFSIEHTLQIEDQYAEFTGDSRRLNS